MSSFFNFTVVGREGTSEDHWWGLVRSEEKKAAIDSSLVFVALKQKPLLQWLCPFCLGSQAGECVQSLSAWCDLTQKSTPRVAGNVEAHSYGS